MVVESFITPNDARKNPWSLFLLGMLYFSVGMLLALIIFPSRASITAIFLTTLATAPLFVSLLKSEELIQTRFIEQRIPVLFKQIDLISVFFFLFLGFTIASSLWFILLPDWALQSVFEEQINELNTMQNMVTGNIVGDGLFLTILQNNIRVLFFIVLMSFIYGAGAVLIISWNATILGSAVGLFIKERMGQDTINNLAVYFSSLPIGLGQYMVHGSFEIIAYFMASLVGGIISAAVVRKRYKSTNFMKLIRSATVLISIALLFLVISAYIEVNI